jgi:hypothetical protein
MSRLLQVAPLIAVIHSGESDRNAYLMPRLEQLASDLGGKFVAVGTGMRRRPTVFELVRNRFGEHQISHPASLSNYGAKSALVKTKQLMYSVYQTARSLRHDLKSENFEYFTKQYNVLSKHHIAWQKLLSEPEGSVLIVLENDARFKPTIVADLDVLLARLAPLQQHDFIFCDLAGGMNANSILRGELLHPSAWLDQVGLPPTPEAPDRYLVKLPKFVTNTVCAYLMNQKVAAAAVNAFGQIGILSPDWFLNQVLFEIDRQTDAIACYHALPPMFEHGSAAGTWQSTISNWALYET